MKNRVMKMRITNIRKGGNLMKNRITKTIPMALALILMLTMTAGCPVQAPEVDPTPIAETRIIVDQRGIEVEVPKQIERLVALPMPLPSIIFSIVGSGESVIGMHPTSMVAVERGILAEMAPELLKADTGFVTKGFEVNLEELLKLNPDVVIQWGHVPEVVEAMERAGLPVIVIEVRTGHSQDNFEEWLRIVGELFGKEERAAELAGMQREIISEVMTRVAEIPQADRPSTLLLFRLENGLVRTVGEDVHHNYWIEGSGGINVARDLSGWKNVDMEQILEWNPEVIFISNFTDIMPQDILENRIPGQDWSHIDAVINGRVYKIPEGVYRWEPPNAERALLFKWAAQKYFPEVFADLDMQQIVRGFYREFFEYELTDEEIRTILHYDAN
ncbi:ABC transporter substrate-binding protein [Dehalococcoidia bacterium]|nr:ABC transporter substrate-binding protein [Dehalococcoidia bacterium]